MSDPLAAVDVSLEPQLLDALKPLSDLLPEHLSSQLSPLLSSPLADNPLPHTAASVPNGTRMTPTIPYPILLSLSKWSRTPEGRTALQGHTPPLDPRDYDMVTLLAGTRTMPNSKFPAPERSQGPAHVARREMNDRRAIVAVLNALLSVGGAGAATWWAAQQVGWKDEWKVILALLAASAVGISELALYMIWESRVNAKAGGTKRPRSTVAAARKKKHDDPVPLSPTDIGAAQAGSQVHSVNDVSQTSARATPPSALRQRPAAQSPS